MQILPFISKYFFPIKDDKEFYKLVDKALNASFNFLQNKDGQKIHPNKSTSDISKLFSSFTIPEHGSNINDIINNIVNKVIKYSVCVSNPYFIGHMTGATPHFSILCDIIINALNQNVVKIETALSATYLENQTLIWLHRLIYEKKESFYLKISNSPNTSLGNVCSGGTIGNITALVVARNFSFKNIHKKGIFECYKKQKIERSVIFVSTRGHYSIKKASALMGLGEDNVIPIPCDSYTNKINLELLLKKILHFKKKKIKTIAIVGVAGSTETGSVDDLESLAKIAQKFKIWFHVDAAWGGAILLSEKHKALLRGIEKADSVVIDGHKLMYLNMSHSAVIFKNEHSLDVLRHNANYIIREGSVDLGRTTIEGSRRFDSLKLWFSMHALGRTGYEHLINLSIYNSQIFAKLIENHPNFELTSEQQTNILTYRFLPKTLKKQFIFAKNQFQNNKNHFVSKDHQKYFKNLSNYKKSIWKINLFLNELNTNLQKIQRHKGESFVSRTTLESVWKSQEIVVLRAVPFHPLTNQRIFSEILTEQKSIGESLIESSLSKLFKEDPLTKLFFNDYDDLYT